MSKVIWWLIAIFGAGIFALIIYFALPTATPEPVAQSTTPAAAEPPAFAEPQILHPIARQPEEKPLPALETSDATMRNALDELLSDKTLIELFQLQDFVRHVVATVDNLPRQKIALRLMPVKPAAGAFLITGKDAGLVIGTDNAARYALYLRLADALDTAKLVALYSHFYPLFQQAYQELGYPKGYFNDRLIEVIDHLLAAPEVQAPVKLVRPKVVYLFADPELEARSAGQKLLIRVGSENAALIKTKLRDIRNELIRQGGTGSRPSVPR
jgi:Protein of unknown function (DUF3014)